MIIRLRKILFSEDITGMAVWPFIFVKSGLDEIEANCVVNHEKIHIRQQLETLVVPFFVVYFVEYLVRLTSGQEHPYREISFEKEAYENDVNVDYLNDRKFWSFVNYF